MPTYRLDIVITTRDRASRPLFSIQRGLRRIFQIASGILVAGVVRELSNQIKGIGTTAFDAFTDLERMNIALENLIGREIARGEIVETTNTMVRRLTEAEVLRIDKLTVEYHELSQELEDTRSHYNDMVEEFGEGSIEALSASIAIRELEGALAETGDEMERLKGLEGALITEITTHREGTLSLAEALKIAVGPAKQLSDWIVRLALLSPFDEEQVMNAFRVVQAYGFITQLGGQAVTETERLALAQETGEVTAQRLTLALIDLVSAMGLPQGNLRLIAVAVGQIRAHGRLLGQEIRQLVNAGIGVELMAESMGLTIEEFQALQREGKILAEDFVPALITLIERDFAGAAERVLLTLGGTVTNLRETFRVLLREFFAPTFVAITPALQELFQLLTSEETMTRVGAAGVVFRDMLIEAWRRANMILEVAKDLRDELVTPFEFVLEITAIAFGKDVEQQLRDQIAATQRSIAESELGFGAGTDVALGAGLRGFAVGAGFETLVTTVGPAALGILGFILKRISLVGLAIGGFAAIWDGDWLGIRTTLTEAWTEDIQPALQNLWKWLSEDAPAAIFESKTWFTEELLPALGEVHDFIETKLQKSLFALSRQLSEGITTAVEVADRELPKFLQRLDEIRNVLVNDVLTPVGEFIDKALLTGGDILGWLFGMHITVGENVLGPLINFIGTKDSGLLGLITSILGFGRDRAEAQLGIIGTIIGFIAQLEGMQLSNLATLLSGVFTPIFDFITVVREQTAETFGVAVASFLEFLQPLIDFFVQDVIPTWNEFWGVLELVRRMFVDLLLGAINNFVLVPLHGLWNFLFEKLSPIWEDIVGFLGEAYEFFHDTLRKAITGFLSAVGEPLETVLGAISSLLEGIRTFLGDIKELLENIDMPWWAIQRSPSPMERSFMDIASAIREADEAARSSVLFDPNARTNMGMFQMGGGSIFDGRMPQQVTVEGDTNTFIVDSEATARLVAHQLREAKIKRFQEYMGR